MEEDKLNVITWTINFKEELRNMRETESSLDLLREEVSVEGVESCYKVEEEGLSY